MIQISSKCAPSRLTMLIKAVETAKMAGDNYVLVAKSHFSKNSFSFKEISNFLKKFQWDKRLVHVVLEQTQLPTEDVLTILTNKKFHKDLCITAGMQREDDEMFILNLIVNCYVFSANCAKTVTRQFKQFLSPSSIIILLEHTNDDPAIAKELSGLLKAV